ncbi:MAG: GyrI-like domain-containing protein [Flavobacteriales bacterium]
MKIVKYVFLLPLVVTLFSCGGEGSEPVLEEEAVNLKTESGIGITEEIVESKSILFISESSSIIPSEISKKMGGAYGEIMALMGIAKLEITSAPIAITKNYSLLGMSCEFDAAVPVVDLPEELILDGRIQKGETYAGKVIKTMHIGSYVKLKATYDGLLAYIEANGYERNGYSWEEYVDDPGEVEENVRKTVIYFPIK